MSKRIMHSVICLILVFLMGCRTTVTDDLPRVVGALSTGNKQVKVSFSNPMNDDAVDPENYSIVQQNPATDDSHLVITGAQFVDKSHTVVELTTMSQNEVRYHLTAISMQDRAGKPLGAKEAVGGVIVDPTSALFQGTPPGLDDVTDSDEDTVSDSAEQRGWDVLVVSSSGREISRHATSDPNNPDTDGDGVQDSDEKCFGTDPRSADTDGDLLTDYQELNEIYSEPLQQDSDGDGLADGLEFNFFKTSPILADTDGDQFSDDQELLELDRDPLIADLPRLQIFVGDARLSLKVVSSYTDETGETKTTEETLQTTFGESRERRFGTSDTVSNETILEYGQKVGVEVSYSLANGFGAKGSFEASFGQTFANGFTSAVNRESAEVSTREYQDSVSRVFSQSQNRSVTRSVEDAQIVTDVSIQNLSDIAFTITNLELSVLRKDRRNASRFIPVAALRLQGAADPTDQPAFNLGPFDPERGPFIFEATSVFPNLVEELMREPQGLVYRVVNFDLKDEFGRNFVFSSQEVNDRTVGITIDFGDGEVEAYRVATHNRFDANGQTVPITIKHALQIVGITQSTEPGGDTPGADPTDPGILRTYGTQRDPDDGVEMLTRIRGVQTDFASESLDKRFWAVISANREVPSTTDFGSIELRARDNFALVFTRDQDQDGLLEREELFYGSSDESQDTDGDSLSDFDEVKTGWSVAVKGADVVQVFSSPASVDTDGDGLNDDVEKQFGTDPTRRDTDFDGLNDVIEILGPIEVLLFDGDADETNNPVLFVPRYKGAPAMVNGLNETCDTTATGDDVQQVELGAAALEGQVVVSAGENAMIDTEPNKDQDGNLVPKGDDYLRVAHGQECLTDPLNPDTDYDSVPDGREVIVGINPNRVDAGSILDSDGDGLSDDEEDLGWDVAVNGGTPARVTSDKFRVDTDRDGIPDVYERAIATNPRSRDTDGDLLFDYREFDAQDAGGTFDPFALADAKERCQDASHCFYDPPDSLLLTSTDPRKTDTDGDGLTDKEELGFGSDPTVPDTDGDGLDDGEEKTWGTNPNDDDTDSDGLGDGVEIQIGTDPLVEDRLARIEFVKAAILESDDEGVNNCVDWGYWVEVKKNAEPAETIYYEWDVTRCVGNNININQQRSYILTKDDLLTITIGCTDVDLTGGNEDCTPTIKTLKYDTVITEVYRTTQRAGDDGTIETTINIVVVTQP